MPKWKVWLPHNLPIEIVEADDPNGAVEAYKKKTGIVESSYTIHVEPVTSSSDEPETAPASSRAAPVPGKQEPKGEVSEPKTKAKVKSKTKADPDDTG